MLFQRFISLGVCVFSIWFWYSSPCSNSTRGPITDQIGNSRWKKYRVEFGQRNFFPSLSDATHQVIKIEKKGKEEKKRTQPTSL